MPYSRACNASDELSRGRSGWLTDNIFYSTARHIDDLTACDGIKFWMSDGERPVLCRVSHEALRDLADRVHFGGSDEKVFEAYRELIEQVASDAYDAGTSVDEFGLVLVTSEALARVGRSA